MTKQNEEEFKGTMLTFSVFLRSCSICLLSSATSLRLVSNFLSESFVALSASSLSSVKIIQLQWF
uniref:Uncharacterized protein n=1 Tax=Parascaris equorum TaxID=6256 RepID=A0A914RIJ5_PAREQ